MMLFSLVGTELMRMYFKSTRIQLRCEVIFNDALHPGWNLTHGDVFKSTRIQLRCEVVLMMLFNRIGTEPMGMYSNPLEFNYVAKLFL